jgi:hypothetical protein
MDKKNFFLVIMALLLSGCSALLPKKNIDSTTFQNFDEAVAAIEAIVPMQSDRASIRQNGLDFHVYPNAVQLTHADVVRRFLPSTLLTRQDLDPGILLCLESRDACRGVELSVAKIHKERKGNFFADLINFHRVTHTTGWRFHAVVLFVNDLVVYRSWGGQAVVNQREDARNPLGPFQNIASGE